MFHVTWIWLAANFTGTRILSYAWPQVAQFHYFSSKSIFTFVSFVLLPVQSLEA